MKLKSILFLTGAVLLPAAGAWADVVPYTALQQSSSATTDLGSWSIRGWSDHHKFPALKESADAEKGTGKPGSSLWNVTGGNASVAVKDAELAFSMGGTVFKNGWDAKYNWIPALQFKPNSPGAYKLTGQLNLWGRGFANQKIVAWALFRAIDSDIAVVDEQRYEAPENVDLGSRARLKAVKVAEGESLVLAVWHPSFNFSSGGRLTGLEITKASTADIAAMDAQLKAEKEAAAKAYQAAVQAGKDGTSLPLIPLAATGVAETKAGKFSIAGLADREKFPAVESVVDVEGKDTFVVPDGKDVRVAVKTEALAFFTRGRNGAGKGFTWAPALLFKPISAGNYAVSGKLSLFGKASSKPENPDAVAFAIFKLKNGTGTLVASKKFADKAEVDLAEFAAEDGNKPLSSIALAADESLALTVWRPTWHYEAGANLTGMDIRKLN